MEGLNIFLMDQEDLKTFYTGPHALNPNNPVGLQNKVWFRIMFYLCRRGRENLKTTTRDTFALSTDGTGRKHIYQRVDESNKNHTHTSPDDTVGEGRIYEFPGSSMCPVLSFERYISLL